MSIRTREWICYISLLVIALIGFEGIDINTKLRNGIFIVSCNAIIWQIKYLTKCCNKDDGNVK